MPGRHRRSTRKHGFRRRKSRTGFRRSLIRRYPTGVIKRTRRFALRAKSVSRRRSSSRLRRSSRGRSFGRKSSRRVLSRGSFGPKNAIYKYRNSGRRARFVNRRFAKKIAANTGHVLKWNNLTNDAFSGINGQSLVWSMDVGAKVDGQSFYDFALKHWHGYETPDVGTISGSEWNKLKLRVMDHSENMHGINSGTSKIHFQIWGIRPRHDIHAAALMPTSIMNTYLESGNLPDVLTDTHLSTDVDFTPYKVPALTANYVIEKQRGFTVHPGVILILNCGILMI